MSPAIIQKEIEIAAPPAKVWKFVGTANGLSQWWGVDISMEERAQGDFVEVGQLDGYPYRKAGLVTIYDPPRQLSIRLHNVDVRNPWPSRTEVDITLSEELKADGLLHTRVSVIHRALVDEMDALRAKSLLPVQPTTDDVHSPTMMLPQNRGFTGRRSTSAVQAVQTEALTVQDLYQWRYRQEQTWQQRFATLTAIS